MHHSFSQISALPVTVTVTVAGASEAARDKEEKKTLGHINGAFIHPETGQIIGFLVGYSGVLAPTDIQKWGRTGIEVADAESIASPWDILRIEEYGLKRTFLNGKKVVSRSGTYLGRVRDFSFDSLGCHLLTIETSKKFWPFEWADRIFPYSDISEITAKAIVLSVDPKMGKPALLPRATQKKEPNLQSSFVSSKIA
ncbi:MAG: PRC-barrel domain-containing protein [Candidatus Gracilibacteria bacterium]|jgi:uncharacterized protein YrrD